MKSLLKPSNPPTTPINEGVIRSQLSKMCRLPLLFNIIEGLVPFTLDKQNKYHFSFYSIPTLITYLKTIFQIIMLIEFTNFSKRVERYFSPPELQNGAENYITYLVAYIVTTSGQVLLRITYLLLRKKIPEFQENLTKLTCDLTIVSHCPSVYLCWIKDITRSVEKVAKIVAFFTAFVTVPTILILVLFFVFTSNSDFTIQLVIYIIAISDYLFALNIYIFLSIWFVLYIKWINMCFHMLSKNCANFMQANKEGQHGTETIRRFMKQLDALEALVIDFNKLFQVPLIIWLLSITFIIIMELFFVFYSIKFAFYEGVPLSFLFVSVMGWNVFNLANAGSAFIVEARRDQYIFFICFDQFEKYTV